MAKVIIKQIKSFRKEYSHERRTVIDNLKEAVIVKKAIEETDVVFLMDRFGYAKTVDKSQVKSVFLQAQGICIS